MRPFNDFHLKVELKARASWIMTIQTLKYCKLKHYTYIFHHYDEWLLYCFIVNSKDWTEHDFYYCLFFIRKHFNYLDLISVSISHAQNDWFTLECTWTGPPGAQLEGFFYHIYTYYLVLLILILCCRETGCGLSLLSLLEFLNMS